MRKKFEKNKHSYIQLRDNNKNCNIYMSGISKGEEAEAEKKYLKIEWLNISQMY